MAYNFAIGDAIQLTGTNQTGTLISIHKQWAIINFSYVTLKIPISQVRPIAVSSLKKPTQPTLNPNPFDMHKFKTFSIEIDLHGLAPEEALQQLDRWIDKATMVGHTYLRIIHGKGRGLLRSIVHDYLATHQSVKKIIQNHPWPGGTGVTCIEIL